MLDVKLLIHFLQGLGSNFLSPRLDPVSKLPLLMFSGPSSWVLTEDTESPLHDTRLAFLSYFGLLCGKSELHDLYSARQ